MEWSQEQQPNEHTSRYNHVFCETPLGRFIIEWKGWKEHSSPTLILDDEYIASLDTLDEAKRRAWTYLTVRLELLQDYLVNANPPDDMI